MAERLIGHVTHWFGGIGVAGVHIDEGELRVGDRIHVVGAHSDLEETVESIEIEHHRVPEARAGEDIGIRMIDHVREHDRVYLVN